MGIGALACAATRYSPSAPAEDVVKLSLAGVNVGQVGIAALALIAVCNEYASGMIRVTFTAMPRRLHVLGAKAIIVATLALATSVVAVLGSLLCGRLILPH
ncbi:MAG TPA: hypothetical protein VGM78_06545, partial [Ilumatobacteraceae bacterium]